MAVKAVFERSPYYQQQAFVTYLPRDITILILSLLPGNQVARARGVCRYYYHAGKDKNLWKFLFQRDFPKREISEEVTPLLAYSRCFQTETNWKKGQYVYQRLTQYGTVRYESFFLKSNQFVCADRLDSIQVWDLRGPSLIQTVSNFNNVDDCILGGDWLIAYSESTPFSGNEVRVWNKTTGALHWHTGCSDKPILDGARLIVSCGAMVGHIKVWDSNTREETSLVLDLSSSYFAGLHLAGNYLFARSSTGFVNYWNKDNGVLIRQVGSGDKILCFEVEGENLICGCASGKIQIWNIEDGSLVELSDPERVIGSISIFKVDEDVIMSQCDSKHIICWSKKERTFRFKIGNEGSLSRLDGDRFIVVFGNGDFEIRDKYTGTLLKTYKPGGYRIIKIDINDRRIFSLSAILDHSSVLKIWNKHTGDLLFILHGIYDYMVMGDRMVISYPNYLDVCDFSSTPEIRSPNKGQLPQPTPVL